MRRDHEYARALTAHGPRSPRARLALMTIFAFTTWLFVPMAAGASSHVIDTLAITTLSLPGATDGIAYNATLGASGGTQPYVWSILTGAVPLGLVLNSSGTVSGFPAAVGPQAIELRVTDATGFQVTSRVTLDVVAAPAPPQQVEFVSRAGLVTLAGNVSTVPPSDPPGAADVVAAASSPTGAGSWCVTRSGQVFATGSVESYGSLPIHLARNGVVGIASNAQGTGYWIATRGGRVYGFGAARSLGSLNRTKLSGAVVAIARSNGNGYYLLERSGRVTGFGSDVLDGYLHAHRQRAHVVGIAATPGGRGYWVVASDGRVFSFGTARADHPVGPVATGSIVGIVTAPAGIGYYLVARDGEVFSYGSALALAPVAVRPSDPVVAISASS